MMPGEQTPRIRRRADKSSSGVVPPIDGVPVLAAVARRKSATISFGARWIFIHPLVRVGFQNPWSAGMSFDPLPPDNPYAPPIGSGYASSPTPDNTLAIAALVTGVVGLTSAIVGFCCCPLIGIPLPAIALGLGIYARKTAADANGRTMALVGLVLGAVGLAVALISLVFLVFSLGMNASLQSRGAL
jgi:hypothetical protein